MFSGIIEEAARVTCIAHDRGNMHLTIACSFADDLHVDQSIAHNGVCLTVTGIDNHEDTYQVTAIRETLQRSNLATLSVGDLVNLERSLPLGERLDGHIVQGHVDATAICRQVDEQQGSWLYTFEYHIDPDKARQGYLTVDKGAIAVNGVSLTVCNPADNAFSVAIIPYTRSHTNFRHIAPGAIVNLEFDILGKYIARLLRR